MGTFNIAQRIDVRDVNPNIDALYGPYNSLEEACLAVPTNRRAIGRTVAIIENSGAVEYWWKSGVADTDLIVKVMETVPHLEYTDEYPEGTTLHADLGMPLSVTVRFTSQSYGQCTLTIYKDGAAFKSIKANKGIIVVDLGVPPSEGTSVYTITGIDALTIPAEESLTFRAVIGGAKITSDFQDILDAGINTSSSILLTYSASTADTSKTIKVLGELIDAQGRTVLTHHNQGSGNTPYILSGQQWEMGVIANPGIYILRLSAYTGSSPSDTSGDNVTTQVSYNFTLMDAGSFSMFSPTQEVSADTNTAIIIPFRIYSGSNMTLQAHGQVIDNQGNVVENYELDRSVQSNVLNYWSLGKLRPEGNYSIKLWATTVGGEDSPSGRNYVIIPATVARYIPNYEISRNGLMAEFLAEGRSNNNDSDTKGYWPNDVAGSSLYFQLVDLNYNTNGWKHVNESIPDSDPTGEMMLKFSGDSYGRLKQMVGSTPQSTDPDYNIMGNLPSSANDGFTAEIIFRTRCIGELDSKVITSHRGKDTNTAGFSANFEKITVGSNDSQVVLDVAEDEWIHATMVIDKTIHMNVEDVQDYAPRKLMTLYINGSACAAAIITDNMVFTNNGPTLLNAAINQSSNLVDYFGACEIKAIRFYNRPLYASEVVNNYIASVYGEERQAEIAGRNGDVLPIVRFININASHPQNPLPDGCTLVDFATLNQMTEKSQQKKKYVCSRILYQENSEAEIIEWPRCIIQTQGTSTLAFPVKNYKIRLFDNPDNPDGSNPYKHKYKTNAFADKGWDPENVYTLKCDYMEAAHLNNTPSCEFYNDMIDALVADGTIKDGWNENHTEYHYDQDERTPARRDDKFDAIRGFPCLVYYYESEADFEMGNGTYVGSYMFNLDKAANSLGFDAPAMLDEDGETSIEGLSPREGEDQVENICQSFEGVANGSDTAGCFFSYEDWKTSFYETYLDIAFARYHEQGGTIDNMIVFCEYYISLHPDEQYRDASQDSPTEFSDGGYLMGKDAYIAAASPYEDEYDYFASDFEMRYDWDDLEEGGEEFWGNDEWGLKRMIDWVSAASETSGTQNDIFRDEFDQYFNLKYVLLYYLQMIVFGQVDNAGKNSMWDTWDGTHWAPRPYDLDTMAGLDNTGFEVINPDAELLRELSPFMAYNNTTGTASYSEDISELANIRYRAYNTRTSKFWKAFAVSFKTEINAMYKHLRDSGIYSIEHIMDKFLGKTSDIIGEAYYNRDMATKFYKLSDIETFITRMHGNRVQRFRAWMSKRIIFCDTLFDYTSPSLSLNNNIVLRSDALESGSTISLSVGIKVYSPEYVRIDVGSGYDAKVEAYCSPDAQYIDPITGERMEGTLFTIPLAAGDKEIQISGGGNIREIVNLGALKPKSLTLNYAKKITSLDLSYSTKLLALSLAANTYLQSLDCRGDVQLGTDASGAQLDLSNCVNLKYVYLDNTKLTSVVFPAGGSIKEVSLRNTAITALSLDSLHFLTSVDVTNCTKIINYSITNCPKIQTITANELPLVNVTITDCTGLENISLQSDNSIASINIARCPSIHTLDFKNNRSASLKTIDLTTLYSLASLDISGSTVETVKFPKNKSASSVEEWGEDFTTFRLSGSSIKYVQYGETSSPGVDMSQLIGLTAISFNNCQAVESIYNLNYTGSCANLFNSCTHLQNISGTITCIGSANYIFGSCYALTDISQVAFNFSACSSLVYGFYRCPWITYAEVKRVLDSCGTALTSINSMCYEKGYGASYGSGDTAYTQLPARFFGNCKNVTSMSSAFYSAKLKSIPESAFKDSNGNPGLALCATLTIAFCSNSGITSMPTNLMRLLPSATNVSGMFQNDSGITTTLPSNFFEPTSGDSNITNIKGMFYGCSNMVINMSNMANLLAPLTKLTNASLLFAGCTKCTGVIPEGFFAVNTRLTTISACFMNTRISGLPAGSLFRANGDTTTVFSALANMNGVFQGCSYLTSVPGSDLFAGASNVTSAGSTTLSIPTGGNITITGVFYNCTGITTFGKDIFKTMPRLQNISGFFYNCSGLVSQAGGGFDADILNTHEFLTDVHNLFRGCTSLSINSVPSLFTAAKSKITDASGIFMGCTSISDFTLDLFANMTKLTNANNIFNGCTSLGTAMSSCLLFEGCTSLQTTQGAFSGCTGITGSIPNGLFNSCRSTINDVSKMFYGCTDLNGSIGTGNEDMVSPSSPAFELGLLAECLSLTNTSQMFYGCNKLKGKIPWDIFWTSSVERLYTGLSNIGFMFYDCAFNQPVEVDGTNYLFHPDMFIKLLAVTTMEGLFANPSNAIHSWPASYPVHPNAFDGQYFLTTIKEMFRRCNGLGGAIPNRWFNNSISRITNAYGAFAYTKITDIGATFLRANADTANTALRYASRMFYNCTQITGNLPAMNSVSAFSRIDYSDLNNGYGGYAYNDTNAANYGSFSEGWIQNMNY